jgi:hypothetical protein
MERDMFKYLPLVTLMSLVGCNSNPYSEMNRSKTPPPIREEVRPTFGIDIPDVLSFDEGSKSEFSIRVSVPNGKPQIDWNGLPDGASYDIQKGILSWKPSFTDANDPLDLSVKSRDYLVTLILRSDADQVSAVKKTVIFKVKDTPRPILLNLTNTFIDVIEGQEKVLTGISVSSLDFPNGPFRVLLKSGKTGTLREGERPGEWDLWTPGFSPETIKVGRDCRENWSCFKEFEETISVFTPDGRVGQKSIKVRLGDSRFPVALSLPKEITTSGDLALTFSGLDQNMEVLPQVSIEEAPEVGDLSLSLSSDKAASEYEGKFRLSWTQIPLDAYGKTYFFKVRACNSSNSGSPNSENCKISEYQLKLLHREVYAPTVARESWSATEMKYMISGKTLSTKIPVSSGGAAQILSVKTSTSDPDDTVSYESGTLSIKASKMGVKFAKLEVTNSIGGVTSESFLYEVLPGDWSSNLTLGFSGDLPELSSLESLLGSFNRALYGTQGQTARSLFNREVVAATTHALSIPTGINDLDYFSRNIKNVLISSPKLSSLPASIISELRSHGVYLAGRGSDISGFNLKDYELTVSKDLGIPKNGSLLAGSTTSESSNPGFLSATVASDCKRLFSLFRPGPVPSELLMGVSCERENGGRLIVLGFDWADVRVSEIERDLPSQWFQRMRE